MGEPPVTFAGLVRQLRTEAGLTQEELAAAARLRLRTVGGVERGVVGIHAISGMAWVGKTAFAVHAAHALADRFPGGQIPPGTEARMGLWRDQLARRQLLLVLDDAVGSEQVLALLTRGSPRSPRCAGTCRWRSGWWPASCAITRRGRWPGGPPSWPRRRAGSS